MVREKVLDMQKQLLMERSSRCRVLGKKYGSLFSISIFEVVALVILQVIAWGGLTSGSFPVLRGSGVAIGLVTLFVAILFGSTVFSLGKYYDGFKSAGWLYLLYQSLSVVIYTTLGSGMLIFSFIASLFGILYIVSFSSAMQESFNQVDEEMASTWVRFKKIYLLVQIGWFISFQFAYFSRMSRVFGIVLLAMSAADIVLRIWQFILLGESSSAMDKYVNFPSEE